MLKEELRLLWPFYLMEFLTAAFTLVYPIMVIYLAARGFTFFQIALCFSAIYFGSVIFEVPTGAIADLFGRKISVVLGLLGNGLCIIIIPSVNTFPLLLLLFFAWSGLSTLISGADEAWIVDLLKHEKKKKLIRDYFTKRTSIIALGFVIAGLLCGLITKIFGMDMLWFTQGSVFVLSAFLLVAFGKEYFIGVKKIKLKEGFKKTFKTAGKGINYSIKHPVLLSLILAGIFIAFACGIGNIAWQPLFKNLGLPVYWLGYLYSISACFGIVLPFFSKPLLKIFKKERYYLAFIIFIDFILLVSIYFIAGVVAAALVFIALGIAPALAQPILRPYIQRFIPTKIRATIGSVESMFVSIGGGIALLFAGLLADMVGPKMTIVYSSLFLIPAIIFYLKLKR